MILHNSQGTIQGCTLNELGRGLHFAGAALESQLLCNEMHDCHIGLELFSGGFIGPQGDLTHVNDNRWIGNFPWDTYCFNSWGNLSPLFVRSDGGAEYIPVNNESNSLTTAWPFLINQIDPAFSNCTSTAKLINPSNGSSVQDAGNEISIKEQVAINMIDYKINPEANQWMAKQWLYSQLLKDSLLAASSPVFEVFIDSVSGSNTGTLYAINQFFSDTTGFVDSVAIANANTNIMAQNVIETNYKTVINIYQSMLSQGLNNLTQGQIETLESIAVRCPYTDGNAVYSARSILFLISPVIYVNECEVPKDLVNSEKGMADTHEETEIIIQNLSVNEKLEIYPNPATDVLHINYSLSNESYFEIYNVLGRKLVSILLNSGTDKKSLSLKEFSKGVYYLKVIKNNKIIKSKKIVIMN